MKVKVLHRQNPHCHWCGRLTYLTKDLTLANRKQQATIDHIFSQNNPARSKKNKDLVVLACYECNNQRAHDEQVIMFKQLSRSTILKLIAESMSV